ELLSRGLRGAARQEDEGERNQGDQQGGAGPGRHGGSSGCCVRRGVPLQSYRGDRARSKKNRPACNISVLAGLLRVEAAACRGRPFLRRSLTLERWLVSLVVLAVACANRPAGPQLKNLELSDIRGQKHTLAGWRDRKAVVLFFLSTECPVSNGYAPE